MSWGEHYLKKYILELKDWLLREERYQGAPQGNELPVKCDIEYWGWITLEGVIWVGLEAKRSYTQSWR